MRRAQNMSTPTSLEFLTWVHRTFYEAVPGEFRFVAHPDGSRVEIVPGQLRTEGDPEIAVGRHQPAASARVAGLHGAL